MSPTVVLIILGPQLHVLVLACFLLNMSSHGYDIAISFGAIMN